MSFFTIFRYPQDTASAKSSSALMPHTTNPETERQEKLLAKLQWMTDRSKRDFKGNPPPFERAKTRQTVEEQRVKLDSAAASEFKFLPFTRGNAKEIALDSTRTDYLKGVTFRGRAGSVDSPQYGRQRVDPESGLTEIQRALCWDCGTTPHVACGSNQVVAPLSSNPTTGAHAKHRINAHYLASLPLRERAAILTDVMLANPRVTAASAELRRQQWLNATQAKMTSSTVDAELRTYRQAKKRNLALEKPNLIRMYCEV